MHEHLLWNQEVYQKPIDPNTEEGKFVYSKIIPENMQKIRLYNLHRHRQNAKQTNPEEAAEEAAEEAKERLVESLKEEAQNLIDEYEVEDDE